MLDIKEADSDWVMNTEAVVASELRKIKADTLMLEISDAKIDLDRASHAVAKRKARQVYEEEIESRKIRVEKNQAHHELDLEEKKQSIKNIKDFKITGLFASYLYQNGDHELSLKFIKELYKNGIICLPSSFQSKTRIKMLLPLRIADEDIVNILNIIEHTSSVTKE